MNRGRIKLVLSIVVMAVVIGVAVKALARILRDVSLDEILHAMGSIDGTRIAIAEVLGIASYVVLTGYDVIALRTIGKPLTWRRAAMASLVSYNLSHNFGMAALTGTAARYRIYTTAGLTTADVARITILTGVAFWIGVVLMLGFCLILVPDVMPALGITLDRNVQTALGVVILAGNLAYLFVLGRRRGDVGVGKWTVPLPSLRLGAAQYVLSIADLVFAAGVLIVLIPTAGPDVWPQILVAYVSAFVVVLITHAPGGAGVLEAVVLTMLPDLPKVEVLSGLIMFRLVYHLAPLAVSLALLAGHEIHHRRRRTEIPV